MKTMGATCLESHKKMPFYMLKKTIILNNVRSIYGHKLYDSHFVRQVHPYCPYQVKHGVAVGTLTHEMLEQRFFST